MMLTRREGESIIVNGVIKITLHRIKRGNRAEIRVVCPPTMSIDREEVHLAKLAEQKQHVAENMDGAAKQTRSQGSSGGRETYGSEGFDHAKTGIGP